MHPRSRISGLYVASAHGWHELTLTTGSPNISGEPIFGPFAMS